MTARELIQNAYRTQPHLKLAIGNSRFDEPDSCIGSWDEGKGRYVVVAGKLLTGEWCSLPYEIIVNGEPIPVCWTPITDESLAVAV